MCHVLHKEENKIESYFTRNLKSGGEDKHWKTVLMKRNASTIEEIHKAFQLAEFQRLNRS